MSELKYAITGTGRCGTTFLMMILSELGLDTGFNDSEASRIKRLSCNSGYESVDPSKKFIKSPAFLLRADMRHFVERGYHIFILQRNFEEVTRSQKRYQGKDGGCILVKDEETHPNKLSALVDKFIDWCIDNKITYTIIDFHVMTKEPRYLYDILCDKGALDNIDFNTFKSAWEYADKHQKRK